MNAPVQILGVDGQALTPNRARLLAGGSNTPYDAADVHGEHMAAWQPYLWSPDAELNIYRDRIVSRVRDLVRNDGWASGTVTRILDNAIGANFRPVSKPDYRMLAAYTGLKTFDHAWARDFGNALDAHYRNWALDPGRWCDAQRNLTVPQIFYGGFRHKMVDGDALAQVLWLTDRLGPGRARYATAVQLIDPDRLSNPQLQFDQATMRGGVEVDQYGAARAYWIRRAHAGDWFAAADSVTWDRIPRETEWGRPIIVHDFERTRAGQHRGGAGVLAPVMQRLKMLIKYDGSELDAAILNAVFSAYIESPFDPQLVADAMGDSVQLSGYQSERKAFHDDRRTSIGGNRMPIMFPGEKINTVTAARPTSNFKDFEGAVLRNVASGSGVSAQQVSNDWSDVNYSSARAALLEAWKTMTRRRDEYAIGFGAQVRSAFVEESFEVDDLPLPAGAPDFIECRAAYLRCQWIGPGRGWIDPVAEREGAVLGMEAALSTLERECAENGGDDWEENLDQRHFEIEAFKARGMPVPTWAGVPSAMRSNNPMATRS